MGMAQLSGVIIVVLVILGFHEAQSEHIAPLVGLDSKDRLPHEYIVLLRPSTLPLTTRVEAFKQYGTRQRLFGVEVWGQVQMREFMALHVYADDAALDLLRRNPEVSTITTNNVVKISAQETWTSEIDIGACIQQDTGKDLWGLTRTSYHDKPDYTNGKYSYNARSGDGVTAYVIDSGIYIEHNDFEGRAVWGYTATNFTDEGDRDLNGHGTHVAGTIGGITYGVAKNVKLVAVKVCGETGACDAMGIIQGIAWACNDFLQNQAREKKFKAVINMSLGGGVNIVEDIALQVCTGWGMIFVVAAGNEGADACYSSPARMSSAITVGATDVNDSLADFSNWGACVDILAPGVGILSAWIGSPTSIDTISGTSMASPHVAGVVARYLSGLNEQPTPAQVKAKILDMAQRNKVNLGAITDYLSSTPNLLLHVPCATVEAKRKDAKSDDVLIIASVTLSLVCVLLIGAILAGAFWGYMLWKKTKGSDPHTAQTQDPAPQSFDNVAYS